jgi:hypothetical protein
MNTLDKQICEVDCCSRVSGKSLLKEVIDRLNNKAKSLQTVYDMLPEKPTPEQDEAIWLMVLELKN